MLMIVSLLVQARPPEAWGDCDLLEDIPGACVQALFPGG